jgi:hypothetical protein
MRLLPALALTAGCAGTAPPCQPWQTDKAAVEPVVHLTDESPTGSITVQIAIPSSERYPEGTPVAVFVHGGWNTEAVPLSDGSPRLASNHGYATVYLNLPGGDETESSDGSSDQRGWGARQALAAVLRYAAGESFDDGRCTLSDRLPGGTSGEVVMAGWSNGGNLAWATAADAEVEIPSLDGIAVFESPISSQMVTVEPGTTENPGDFFYASSCALTDQLRLSCGHGYPHISWDPDVSERTEGALFIDDNANDLRDSGESTLDPVWSPAHDAWVHPVEALQAAGELPLVRRASLEEAEEFWAEREASVHIAGALARFPALAGIATGTEIDHVLSDIDLPVHVTGMVAAMQAAGLGWSRLHPDSAYVDQIADFPDAQEYDADMALDTLEPLLSMEPEDGAHVRGTDYISAAIVEIMDRAHSEDWSPDLSQPIVEHP